MLGFSFYSCSVPGVSHTGFSTNIEESLKNDVFISETAIQSNVLDSMELVVKESWIENTYLYTADYDVVIGGGRQICIILEDSLPWTYNKTWLIGVNNNLYFHRNGYYGLICELPYDMKFDKPIEVDIQLGASMSNQANAKKEIIGKLKVLPK